MMPQYPDLGSAIRSVCNDWCRAHGYHEPFCRNGEWWAFPPGGILPVQIKTVMGAGCSQRVKIDCLTLSLLPDGSLSSGPG